MEEFEELNVKQVFEEVFNDKVLTAGLAVTEKCETDDAFEDEVSEEEIQVKI